MDCNICHQVQQDGFRAQCRGIDYVEVCPTNDVPKLDQENYSFREFLWKVLPGLCDAEGGFQLTAIETQFRVYGIASGVRPYWMDKCLAVIEVIRELRDKTKNG